MPRTPKVPTYRRHKARNLAFVLIGKRPKYLGRWNSPESKAEYARVIREWATSPVGPGTSPMAPTGSPSDLTISEMLVAFFRHAETHYRDRDGDPTHEADNFKEAAKPLRSLYGATLAAEFGPLALQAVRGEMVASGLARTTVNARVGRIRRVFRWAASLELVPSAVPVALKTVAGLQAGRTQAREPDPVGPVPRAVVEATLPHLSSVIGAMVRVQLNAGCRAGEVMKMTTREVVPVDATAGEYRPGRHKGAWRGRRRVIALGPKAMEAIRPFLRPDEPDAFLFSPARAALERAGGRDAGGFGERYNHRAYRLAVIRACDRAFPHPTLSAVDRAELTATQQAELKAWRKAHRWSPLQLRHTAATAIRAAHGLEAAANVLGHARPDTTLIYAERDEVRAREIMADMG